MEIIGNSHSCRSRILTRLAYISHIIVFYGYMHEGAELFRQLCKASRQEWDDNLRAIVAVIMKHDQCKMRMEVTKPVNKKFVKYLMAGHKYFYFGIKLVVKSLRSYKETRLLMKAIIEQSKKHNLDHTQVFDEVYVELADRNLKLAEDFVKEYLNSGFSLKCLKLNFNQILEEIQRAHGGEPDYKFPFIDDVPKQLRLSLKDDNIFKFDFVYRLSIGSLVNFGFDISKVQYPKFKELDGYEYTLSTLYESAQNRNLIFDEGEKIIFNHRNLSFNRVKNSDNLNLLLSSLKVFPKVSELHICENTVQIERLAHILFPTFDEDTEEEIVADIKNRIGQINTIELGLKYEHEVYPFMKVVKQGIIIFPINSEDIFDKENYRALKTNKLSFDIMYPVVNKSSEIFIFESFETKLVYLGIEDFCEVELTPDMVEKAAKYHRRNLNFILYEDDIEVIEISDNPKQPKNKRIDLTTRVFHECTTHNIKAKECLFALPETFQVDYMQTIKVLERVKEGELVEFYITAKPKPQYTRYGYLIQHRWESGKPDNWITNPFKPHDEYFIDMIDVMKQKHVTEFRSEGLLPEIGERSGFGSHPDRYKCQDKMVEYLQTDNRIRDLELILRTNEHLEQILDAIKDNYMLKTVILSCQEEINIQTIEKAHEFAQKRIGLEIKLKEGEKTIYPKKVEPFILYYPQ